MNQHWGDCSIYRANSNICDCGYLRHTISSSSDTKPYEKWMKHLIGVGQSSVDIKTAVELLDQIIDVARHQDTKKEKGGHDFVTYHLLALKDLLTKGKDF